MVVGCVDNVEARAAIEATCLGWSGRLWWLDCGNHDMSGQVILGNKDLEGAEVSPLGFCVGLPLPSLREPDLVRNQESGNGGIGESGSGEAGKRGIRRG